MTTTKKTTESEPSESAVVEATLERITHLLLDLHEELEGQKRLTEWLAVGMLALCFAIGLSARSE